tara:strand:+ start:2471 stop:2626 length:156 start_codon:yes stop_codon:yes gene_type:complete
MKRKYIDYSYKYELEIINKIQRIKLDEDKKNIIEKDKIKKNNSFLLLYGLI